jgi:acetyl esterase/lipase
MNMLYASVGTALQVLSGGKQIHQQQELNVEPQRFWGKFLSQILMSVTAAAAASFYAIVGPSTKSAQVTASMIDYTESHQATHASSVDLLQHTWGMVSLPAVKSVSLQVSRLLKRAAIAERIILGGLPCFILSQPNCPEIVVALNRQRRHEDRRRLSKLNTIFESAYDDSTESHNPRTSSRIVNVYDYPRRDVIIHLTGGGFFAHTIAGDVPFLLDWSADCKAVVLIPEYSLLPEHCFPKALEEITQLYVGLRNGSYVSIIGFHANKIIVTGESSGGNLGAALCVKLCLGDRVKNISVDYDSRLLRSAEVGRLNDPSGVEVQQSQNSMNVRMPDAIMFCCPMLNLSPELTPSRIFGNADPVLPSSLLLVISAAYTRDKSIPECVAADGTLDCQLKDDLRKVHEIHELKKNPLISPIFTPDDILRLFPPTLLYGSSEDPFLDDSVTFNARLRSLGVDSDLRATRHMAHAFWGLGTNIRK